LAVGFWPNIDSLRDYWREDQRWMPTMSEEQRTVKYQGWKKAVTRTFDWVES
jgi:glycerol kinase